MSRPRKGSRGFESLRLRQFRLERVARIAYTRRRAGVLAAVGSYLRPTAYPRRRGQAAEDEDGLIEAQDVLIIKMSDAGADLGLRDGRDLVHHQARCRAQPVAFARLHGQAE